MLRRFGLVLAAAALAACNQSGQSADSGGGGGGGAFPNLFQTAYRAEFTMINPESGQSMPGVLIRDGQKVRMEMNSPQGAMVVISNPDTGDMYTIVNAGGRQIATRSTGAAVENPWDNWSSEMNTTATASGPCSAAGENGQSWTSQTDGEDSTACVTSDGIILSATQNGATTWETTSVQRGPQNASLFQLPPGVQVMDLSNMGNVADMMEKMKGAQGN
jgi:hypothetical protein